MNNSPSRSARHSPSSRLICVERQVLHRYYQSGTVSEIGHVIEHRQRERGSNFLDLLRKARLRYGHERYDIGAIFLGPVTARFSRPSGPKR